MSKFIHHPDGIIIIDDLIIELDVFKCFEPGYTEPLAPFVGREYEPNTRHNLFTESTVEPQSLAWPEGDGYIAKLSHYRLVLRQKKTHDSSTNILETEIKPLWQ